MVMCCRFDTRSGSSEPSPPAPYRDSWPPLPLCSEQDCCSLSRRRISSSESELEWPSYAKRLRMVCTVLAGSVSSSQHGNEPGVAKHHFRLMYRNSTSSSAMKPSAAPRKVVVSMGTFR
uniref:(northern house mosquito) hypothetical protein n=1 Tax=Culex pipiens TaxID=7175 RepID=A0A8D8AD78_CULPI